MKALFIKDWKLLKNQGKMFGAVLVFYGLLAITDNSMGQSILGFFPFLFGFFTISTVSYDEYQHGMTYLLTLPIKRKTYVTEKYLFAMALAGAGATECACGSHVCNGYIPAFTPNPTNVNAPAV